MPTPPTPPLPPTPTARYGVIREGEGPYQFSIRTSGKPYGRRWKELLKVNPNIKLNKKKDNVTNETWQPGQVVRLPDDWPGGEAPAVSGLETV